MKKLNNKGYMIVEIIVSVTIAMIIAYFMMDLIVKLKEKYDYVQNDTLLMTDKIVITNEILGDLYKRDIKCAELSFDNKGIEFTLTNDAKMILRYEPVIDSGTNEIIEKWVKYYEDEVSSDNIFYQKRFSDSLQINMTSDESTNDVKISVENNIVSFIINAETLTSKKNYGVNIIIPVDECDPEMQ